MTRKQKQKPEVELTEAERKSTSGYWLHVDKDGTEHWFANPNVWQRLHIYVLNIDGELIEEARTRDSFHFLDDGRDGYVLKPVRPPGDGWEIHDSSGEKRTVWRRVKP
jgi:hypothetical protein